MIYSERISKISLYLFINAKDRPYVTFAEYCESQIGKNRTKFFCMPLCDDNSYHIYMLEKEIIFFTYVYISCYNILPHLNKCNLNRSGHLI